MNDNDNDDAPKLQARQHGAADRAERVALVAACTKKLSECVDKARANEASGVAIPPKPCAVCSRSTVGREAMRFGKFRVCTDCECFGCGKVFKDDDGGKPYTVGGIGAGTAIDFPVVVCSECYGKLSSASCDECGRSVFNHDGLRLDDAGRCETCAKPKHPRRKSASIVPEAKVAVAADDDDHHHHDDGGGGGGKHYLERAAAETEAEEKAASAAAAAQKEEDAFLTHCNQALPPPALESYERRCRLLQRALDELGRGCVRGWVGDACKEGGARKECAAATAAATAVVVVVVVVVAAAAAAVAVVVNLHVDVGVLHQCPQIQVTALPGTPSSDRLVSAGNAAV